MASSEYKEHFKVVSVDNVKKHECLHCKALVKVVDLKSHVECSCKALKRSQRGSQVPAPATVCEGEAVEVAPNRNQPALRQVINHSRRQILAETWRVLSVIIMGLLPFSCADLPDFWRSGYEPKGRKAIVKRAKDLETFVSKKLHTEHDSRKDIVLLTDIWTSRSLVSLLLVKARFLDDKMQWHQFVPAVFHLPEAHTAEAIHARLQELITSWRWTVVCVVADGSNIVAAVHMLGVVYVHCLAHRLQLCVHAAVDRNHELMIKVRKFVAFTRKSYNVCNKLASTAATNSLVWVKPQKDQKTRWGSSYLMIRSVVKIRHVVACPYA
eukprot:TRINITY_DN3196_c0_g1_i1.p1 TRINITY_DN3196_c0_g1~~TRINITY_DN3196_c0_g1_i1.p1  ORF type:complete len:350 (-),score=51.79 TRINITY_DN3196_c0_g1_i1:888-1862(-)